MTNNIPPFKARYPLSAALGLVPVSTAVGVEHPGADEDDVRAKLGTSRFVMLMLKVTHVFSCGHRKYVAGTTRPSVNDDQGKPVDLGGYEVHCIYLDDIEAFLKAGN